jgi:N-acetylglucosamine-6-sulfatase
MEGRSQLTTRRGLLSIAALVVAALVAAPSALGKDRPNLILINTDDQTLAQLRPDTMPNVDAIFDGRGIEFTQAVTEPLCCPSRASMLTGQYPHNHKVLNNREGYRALKGKHNTLPVWLKRAGYRTGFVGKYLNQYPKAKGLEPAPGFSDWFNLQRPVYYGANFSENGELVTLGDSGGRNHVDNAMTRRALDFVRRSARGGRPFFLSLSYLAPHHGGGPHPEECPGGDVPVPAPRDLGDFASEPLPDPPSYNESNVSDKPGFIRDHAPLTGEEVASLTTRWRCGLEALRSVDRGIGRLREELRRLNETSNTVMVFTSDNGFFFGEHRLRLKGLPYEEASRVPLLFRGPARLLGAPAGADIDSPVASIDLAPTFLDWAGAKPCSSPGECRTMDGRSLLPLLRGGGGSWPEDRGILLELDRVSRQPNAPCTFEAIRTTAAMYNEFPLTRDPVSGECVRGDEAELYDLDEDPFELENLLFTDPSGSAGLQASLAARLDKLRRCAGVKGRDPKRRGRPHCE